MLAQWPPPAKDKAVRIDMKRCEHQGEWYAWQETLSNIYSVQKTKINFIESRTRKNGESLRILL